MQASASYEAKHQDDPRGQGTLHTSASEAASVHAEGSATVTPGIYLFTVLAELSAAASTVDIGAGELIQQCLNEIFCSFPVKDFIPFHAGVFPLEPLIY